MDEAQALWGPNRRVERPEETWWGGKQAQGLWGPQGAGGGDQDIFAGGAWEARTIGPGFVLQGDPRHPMLRLMTHILKTTASGRAVGGGC